MMLNTQTHLACSDRVRSTAYGHHWEQAGPGANVEDMSQLTPAMYDLDGPLQASLVHLVLKHMVHML